MLTITKGPRRLSGAMMVLSLVLASSPAGAGGVTTYFSEAAWLASAPVSGAAVLGDSFEDLSSPASSFMRAGFTLARTDGGTLEPTSDVFGTSPANGLVQLLARDIASPQAAAYALTFPVPVIALSLFLSDINDGMGSGTMLDIDGMTVVDISGSTGSTSGGILTDSVSGSSVPVGDGVNTFMGFTDLSGISTLTVVITSSAVENTGLDFVRLVLPSSAVPAPGTLAIVVLVLLGLATRRPA